MHSPILSLVSTEFESQYENTESFVLEEDIAPSYIDYISEAELEPYKKFLDTTLEEYKDFITIHKDGFTINKPKELNEFLNKKALEEIVHWISDTKTAQHLISYAYKLTDALGRGVGGLLIYSQEEYDLCPFIRWLDNQTIGQDEPITFKLKQAFDYHW